MHPDLACFLALVPAEQRTWQIYDDHRQADGRPRRDRRLSRQHHHRSYVGLADLLARLNAPNVGAAVTITVNHTDGRGRRACNITRIAAIAADIDRQLPPLPLAPSLVIETSPGRHQVWWPIEDTTELTPSQHAGIMAALVHNYGADAGAVDLARVLRVPAFFNNKTAPFRVRIIGGTHAPTTGTRLIEAFPAQPPKLSSTTAAARWLPNPFPSGLTRLHAPLAALPADDYRTWITVGLALHGETGGDADGLHLWKSWSASSAKYDPAACDARWSTFRNPDRIARAGKIFWLASQHGFSPRLQPRRARDPPA